MRDMKMQERKMGDMKMRDMNIWETEYAGQTYAKSNVYTMKIIKFKLTFKKNKNVIIKTRLQFYRSF